MRKVYIKYNPYEMKSVVIVDGKEIQKNKHCDANLKKYLAPGVRMPIQSWIDPIERDGWKGLLETLCLMGDKDIVIEFSGRKIDYESIKESLNAQNVKRKCNAKITFCDLVEEIIPDSQMKNNITEVVNLMLTDYFEEIVKESNSPELIQKYEQLKKTYEEIETEEFRIVFIGTYSSGKSSTINALIGKNLLPTASGTCTAKICRIIHARLGDCFAKVRYEYNGKVKEYICSDEIVVQERIKGAEDAVETIEIYTDLSKLYPKNIESDLNLVIVDTPGTDSAIGNDTEKTEDEYKRLSKKSHIELTKEVLKSRQKEMVVLISDDKLEDDNIVELLDIIEESAEQDNGAFNDRFLFVMNMCDSLSYSNQGETLENYVKNFIANIKKVPNSSRIRNIVNPRVFPITSGVALAIVNGFITEPGIEEGMTKKAELYAYYEGFCKKVYFYSPEKLEHNFSKYREQIKTQHSNYHNYCLEEQSAVSEAIKYKYEQQLEGDISFPERILIHSGVPALETAIQEYIKSYAYPIRVRQLLSCFTDILIELNSLNELKIEALDEAKKSYSDVVLNREKTKEREREVEKRKEKIVDIKQKMDCVKVKVDAIKEGIPEINNIRVFFNEIQDDIAEKVYGKSEVLEQEGMAIIGEISKKIDLLLGKINDTVVDVKREKKKATDKLYEEFIKYLKELEQEGLMNNGSFSLKDTVAYQQLIDKESFTQPIKNTKNEKNQNKEHIKFGYGIGSFFSSIGRAWKTRKEPEYIERTYILLEKYINDNINPIEKKIDIYVQKLKKDYQNDIQSLKNDTQDRMNRVVSLIENKDLEIENMVNELNRIATNEEEYAIQIDKLEGIKIYLEQLISKISYIQV